MKKVFVAIAALAASVATGFVYCGGDVEEPPTTTTTSGGVPSPAITNQETPQTEAKSTPAVDASTVHVPFRPAPPPLLEVPALPTGPAPVCTTCPKDPPRAPPPPETR